MSNFIICNKWRAVLIISRLIMTTFQRFQRDARSKMASIERSMGAKSSIANSQKLKNLLSFSAREIVFIYDPRQKIATFSLKMTNLTGQKIYFKVRCNNSEDYIVTPFEEVLSDRGEIYLKFEFMPRNGQSHLKDKFQIAWGKVPYNPNQPIALTQSKIFPVVIEFISVEPGQPLFNVLEQRSSPYLEPKPYREELVSYNPPPAAVNSTPGPQSDTLLTRNNIIMVSVVSFILGILLT